MNTDTFTWKGYEWRTHERWGCQHPDKSWTLYSQNCVEIDKDDNLILDIKDHLTNYNFSLVYPMGLVSTTENNPKFSQGIYKWTAKLPKGKHLWPGLWMYSWDCWPPEIDVMEAWTNSCGGYLKGIMNMGINTNIHYGVDNFDNMQHMPSKYCLCNWPARSFNEYKLIWKDDQLQFFYNDKLIRTISGYSVEWTNRNCESGMNIIIDIHPTKDYKDGDMKTPLIIKDFEYIPF